jgi:hypothetical protein
VRSRGEDTVCLRKLRAAGQLASLHAPHLYYYIVHGNNTFASDHFVLMARQVRGSRTAAATAAARLATSSHSHDGFRYDTTCTCTNHIGFAMHDGFVAYSTRMHMHHYGIAFACVAAVCARQASMAWKVQQDGRRRRTVTPTRYSRLVRLFDAMSAAGETLWRTEASALQRLCEPPHRAEPAWLGPLAFACDSARETIPLTRAIIMQSQSVSGSMSH